MNETNKTPEENLRRAVEKFLEDSGPVFNRISFIRHLFEKLTEVQSMDGGIQLTFQDRNGKLSSVLIQAVNDEHGRARLEIVNNQ